MNEPSRSFERIDWAGKIKSAVTMEAALKRYHKLGRTRGRTSCPIHGGTHDNSLSYDDNRWHCFVCNNGGDVIKFVMLLFNLNFKEALQKIGSDFGIALKRVETREEQNKAALAAYIHRIAQQKNEALREYDGFVTTELCLYYRWLSKYRGHNKTIDEQLECVDRMSNQAITGELKIGYDITAMIRSMKRAVLASLGYSDSEIEKILDEDEA